MRAARGAAARLLALLATLQLLRPACSGRAALGAPAGGAHLEAVPDWAKALKLRSLPPEAQQALAATQAVLAQRAERERDAAVPAAVAGVTPPAAPAAQPLPPPAAVEPAWRGGPGGASAADTAAASPPPPPAPTPPEAAPSVREAETDEDGLGTNATRFLGGAPSELGAAPHAAPDAAAAQPPGAAAPPAPDAQLAAALAAHAAAAAAYAEQRCPGCASGGGNCDAERGACDCPIGRAGPACENATLSACELFEGYVTPCGGHLTSCACLAACAAQLRVGLDWFNGQTCLETEPPRSAAGAPLRADVALMDAYFAGRQRRADRVGDPWPVAPSADCGAAGCGGLGVCRGAKRGCACLPGRAGAGCARRAPAPPCLNDCSGRGWCSAGGTAWCSCSAGFWGDDCALSRQAGDAHTRLFSRLPHGSPGPLVLPPPATPPVFVYHLKPACGAYWAPYAIDRPIAEMLHERLAASAHRVADGANASFFFVPLPLRKMQASAAAADVALRCVAELAAAFPHVNATRRGRGHLLATPADWGPSEAWRATWPREGLPEPLRAWTMLTHHGAVAGAAGPLFRRGIDVIMPPLQGAATGFDPAASPLLGGPAPERNVTLFWAGAVSRSAAHAERNMRAAVYDAFRDRPGFVLTDTSSSPPAPAGAYGRLFASARFCLAPAGKGGGWGRRATLAALHGCVPVLLQDATADALDELLDWNAFAVRLDEDDVALLPDILAAISDRRLRRMQRELACAAPRWLYSSVLGAAHGEDGGDDAVESMLQMLHRRALRANGTVGARPAAPCALRRAREAAGCVGAPLPAEGDERSTRPWPAPWPAGGAACVGAAPPCALPRGAPPRCAADSDAAAGFLVPPPEWRSDDAGESDDGATLSGGPGR